MDYAERRRLEIKRWLDGYARTFADHQFVAGRPTVIMLPGGMGSQLASSSERAYQLGDNPAAFDDVVWIDNGLIFGNPSDPDMIKRMRDGYRVRISGDGADLDQFIIMATGPISASLLGGIESISPYDATAAWFRQRGDNYVVFPYDWRRDVGEAATFLAQFITSLRTLTADKVLDRLTLLAHSQGGLVAIRFMHDQAGGLARRVDKLITVATPFYGNPGHFRRYLTGDPTLNLFYRSKDVANITAALPGPYMLISMDADLFGRVGPVLQQLGQDFPVKDKSGIKVDPFSTGWRSSRQTWIVQDFLDAARQARLAYTQPLDPALAGKVFHLRCGRDPDTVVAVTWNFPADPATFDPDQPQTYPPIVEHSYADVVGRDDGLAGDGTVPYWSACLVDTPATQIYDVGRKVAHMDLLEDQEVLSVASAIIDSGALPGARPAVSGPFRGAVDIADMARLKTWAGGLAAGTVAKADPAIMRGLLRRSILA